MSVTGAPEVESVGCPLGCEAPARLVLVGRDRLHGLPGEFQVLECAACGLMRTDPRPSPSSMSFYYPDEYGPYLGTRIQDTPDERPRWRRRLAYFVGRLSDSNADRLPPVSPGRLLELGCASGAYLHRMAQAGWAVEGIEFSEKAAATARAAGYDVQSGPVETASAPSNPPDLIVGWMVLEHLHDPVLALRKLHDWTRPGCWLVASVPNAGSYEFKMFSDAWFGLMLPNHLWHPTTRTLIAILERGGWNFQRVFFHRDLRNFFGSLGNVLEDRGWLPWLAAWLKRVPESGGRLLQAVSPLASVLAFFGQTGRMTIWARRTDD